MIKMTPIWLQKIRSGIAALRCKSVALICSGMLAVWMSMTVASAMDEQKPWSGAPKSSGEGAEKSTPVTRDAMLNSNADRFALRLEKDGGSLQDWMKLVRLYGVLGKYQKALRALARAKQDLKDDPRAIRRLDRFAKLVGLKR